MGFLYIIDVNIIKLHTQHLPRDDLIYSQENYKDYFLRAPTNVIKKTFDATTQYAKSGWISSTITDTHKAPFPAMNVIRRNEVVATDTIFTDVPAIDN